MRRTEVLWQQNNCYYSATLSHMNSTRDELLHDVHIDLYYRGKVGQAPKPQAQTAYGIRKGGGGGKRHGKSHNRGNSSNSSQQTTAVKDPIGHLQGLILPRCSYELNARRIRYFMDAADDHSSELVRTASMLFERDTGGFKPRKREALKLNIPELSDEESSGCFHIEEIYVHESHKGGDLGLRLLHEAFVFMRGYWVIATLCSGPLNFISHAKDNRDYPEDARLEAMDKLSSLGDGDEDRDEDAVQDVIDSISFKLHVQWSRLGMKQVGRNKRECYTFCITTRDYFQGPSDMVQTDAAKKAGASQIDVHSGKSAAMLAQDARDALGRMKAKDEPEIVSSIFVEPKPYRAKGVDAELADLVTAHFVHKALEGLSSGGPVRLSEHASRLSERTKQQPYETTVRDIVALVTEKNASIHGSRALFVLADDTNAIFPFKQMELEGGQLSGAAAAAMGGGSSRSPLSAAQTARLQKLNLPNVYIDDRLKLIEILVSKLGADVDQKDESLNTPLHVAARAGNTHVINCLIALGADPGPGVNRDGETPAALLSKSEELLAIETYTQWAGNRSRPRPRDIDGFVQAAKALANKGAAAVRAVPPATGGGGIIRAIPKAPPISFEGGWMSPRMRRALLHTSRYAGVFHRGLEVGAMLLLPHCALADVHIPAGDREMLLHGPPKSFSLGYAAVFRAFHDVLEVDSMVPTVENIQAKIDAPPQDPARVYAGEDFDFFISHGGKIEYVVDAVIDDTERTIKTEHGKMWSLCDQCLDDIEALPETPLDKAFDVVRAKLLSHMPESSLSLKEPHRVLLSRSAGGHEDDDDDDDSDDEDDYSGGGWGDHDYSGGYSDDYDEDDYYDSDDSEEGTGRFVGRRHPGGSTFGGFGAGLGGGGGIRGDIGDFTPDQLLTPSGRWLSAMDRRNPAAAVAVEEPSKEYMMDVAVANGANVEKAFQCHRTGELILTAAERQRLRQFMDLVHIQTDPTRADTKIVLGSDSSGRDGKEAFSAVLLEDSDSVRTGEESKYNTLAGLFGEDDIKIVLRRTAPMDGCIDFHCDVKGRTNRTLQYVLQDDTEYVGGRLVFFNQSGMHIPRRPAGTVTIHDRDVLHAVSQVHSGTRYSLFVVGSGRKDDFLRYDAAEVCHIMTSLRSPCGLVRSG